MVVIIIIVVIAATTTGYLISIIYLISESLPPIDQEIIDHSYKNTYFIFRQIFRQKNIYFRQFEKNSSNEILICSSNEILICSGLSLYIILSRTFRSIIIYIYIISNKDSKNYHY